MISKKKILYWLGVAVSTFFVALGLIFDSFFSEIVLILSENMGKVVSLGLTAGVMLLGKMMGSILQKFDIGVAKSDNHFSLMIEAFERQGERNVQQTLETNQKIDKLICDTEDLKNEVYDLKGRLLLIEGK